MRRLIDSLLAVSWNREGEMKSLSIRGAVIRIIKRTKVVASALALFVLFFVPWHGWSSVAAASNVTYPVIFIHGIASDASTWASIRGRLEGAGWGWAFGGSPELYNNQAVISAGTSGDFYTLNFSNNQNLSFAQQGAELYEIIKKVKATNQSQKVILVGHSMGGLAARAYLQGLGPQDLYEHDVDLLVTIGTPHLGSYLANFIQGDCIACSALLEAWHIARGAVGPFSVAVTELRYDSCTLGALNYTAFGGCKYNDNRPTSDFRVHRPPPNDVTYISIIGKAIVGKNSYGNDCPAYGLSEDYGDGVASGSSQNFIVSHAESANINIGCSPLPQVHTLETSDGEVWSALSLILAKYKTLAPPPPPLSPPTNLQVSATGDTINASWIGVGDADGYNGYYGYSPGNYVRYIPLGKTTSYSGTAPPETYYIALKAYNASTQSDYSNEVRIVVSAPPLGTPTLQSATQRCDGTIPGIELAWTSVSNATNYEIWRNGSYYDTTNTAGITYWNTSGLTVGQGYTYQVKAKNGSTTSGLSNSVVATAPDCATTSSGALQVTPSGNFIASGIQGGPFTPSSETYTLTNTGGSSISWTASKGQSWVSLSSAGGTLSAGQSTTVTVSINSNANGLSPGSTYSDLVNFTNTTNGNGNTYRTVNLTVSFSGSAISVGPGSLNFGNVSVGSCSTAPFAIQHVSGTGAASGTVSASSNPPFSIISGSSFSVSNGSGANITVQFCPTGSGTFNGTATVSSSANFQTANTVSLTGTGVSSQTQNFTLTVNKAGTGSGTVTSSPPGISCGTSCSSGSASFSQGTSVTLSPSPASGSTFSGWGGACSGTGGCTVSMSSNQTVTATFSTATTCQGKFCIGDVVSVYNSGGGLNLRQCPSITNSTCYVIAVMPDGTQMTVFGGPVTADGYTWWALSGYVQGIYRAGWSAENYLTK